MTTGVSLAVTKAVDSIFSTGSSGRFGAHSVLLNPNPSDIARAAAIQFHDVDGPFHHINKRITKKVFKSKHTKKTGDDDGEEDPTEVDEATREEAPHNETQKTGISTVQLANKARIGAAIANQRPFRGG